MVVQNNVRVAQLVAEARAMAALPPSKTHKRVVQKSIDSVYSRRDQVGRHRHCPQYTQQRCIVVTQLRTAPNSRTGRYHSPTTNPRATSQMLQEAVIKITVGQCPQCTSRDTLSYSYHSQQPNGELTTGLQQRPRAAKPRPSMLQERFETKITAAGTKKSLHKKKSFLNKTNTSKKTEYSRGEGHALIPLTATTPNQLIFWKTKQNTHTQVYLTHTIH